MSTLLFPPLIRRSLERANATVPVLISVAVLGVAALAWEWHSAHSSAGKHQSGGGAPAKHHKSHHGKSGGKSGEKSPEKSAEKAAKKAAKNSPQ